MVGPAADHVARYSSRVSGRRRRSWPRSSARRRRASSSGWPSRPISTNGAADESAGNPSIDRSAQTTCSAASGTEKTPRSISRCVADASYRSRRAGSTGRPAAPVRSASCSWRSIGSHCSPCQRSAWAEHVGWGYRIVVAVVPALHQPPIGRLVNQAIEDRRKLVSRDARGDGTPAVPVSQEDEEVRPAGLALAAGDLLEADLHCALVASRLLAHTPTQIDRLETCPSLSGTAPRVRGNTRVWSASRSICKSSKVELTKSRKSRVMAAPTVHGSIQFRRIEAFAGRLPMLLFRRLSLVTMYRMAATTALYSRLNASEESNAPVVQVLLARENHPGGPRRHGQAWLSCSYPAEVNTLVRHGSALRP